MKTKSILINTGAACGTYVTEVYSNSGKRLGFIRVVMCDWGPGTGVHTLFIAQEYHNTFKHKLCDTLLEAYNYLGISTKELDASTLPEHSYDERKY